MSEDPKEEDQVEEVLSIPRLEMKIEELKEKKQRLEESAKGFNPGCAVGLFGLLLVALEPFSGSIVIIGGLIWYVVRNTANAVAKNNGVEIEGEIKQAREQIVVLKEANGN